MLASKNLFNVVITIARLIPLIVLLFIRFLKSTSYVLNNLLWQDNITDLKLHPVLISSFVKLTKNKLRLTSKTIKLCFNYDIVIYRSVYISIRFNFYG